MRTSSSNSRSEQNRRSLVPASRKRSMLLMGSTTISGRPCTELVQALAQRTYGLIMERVAEVPLTSNPGRDLILGTVKVFRTFVLERPDLFRLFFTVRWRRLARV